MTSKKQRFTKKIFLFIILIVVSLNLLMIIQFTKNKSNIEIEKQTNLNLSREVETTQEWLDNPTFSTQESWISIEQGDNTDFDAEISNDQGNYILLGDQRTYSNISGIPKKGEWLNTTNPDFSALPDFNDIDEYGCHVSHAWIDPDDPVQSPSIHWVRNVEMPVDMSDYEITSASISAQFNASVTTESGNMNLGVESKDDPVDQPGDYDTARFYVLISDLQYNETHEIAWYQTVDLGQDDPEISNITDSLMNSVVQETLIYYLTSLFKRDSYNFRITLGIRIKCIDNFNFDRDTWDSLRIKSCSLNFTYQKRMNQFSSISWNQEGEAISNSTDVIVTGANLRFNYKIDQSWPYILSPNSEIRILINNKQLNETIKLSSATTTPEPAGVEGFDVFSLISKGIHVNVSIQVFLADEFLLNRSIIISIDDVYLRVSLIIITEDANPEPVIFSILFIIALAVSLGLGGYLYLYQKILKYPRPVRKVRKYRFSLKKKNPPDVKIIERETSFNNTYKEELMPASKFLRGKPSEPKITPEKLMKEKEIQKSQKNIGE